MKVINFIFIVLAFHSASAQRYKTDVVISKAWTYLEKAVGRELVQYFELDSNSTYAYRNKFGKTRWAELISGTRTKGSFLNTNGVGFILHHPDFSLSDNTATIYVELDSALELSNEIYLHRIPEFLLNNEPSDWLTEHQIDSIIGGLEFEDSIRSIDKYLRFDYDEHIYYWEIVNTLYEEKCFADCEIVVLDPINGNTQTYTKARLIKSPCF